MADKYKDKLASLTAEVQGLDGIKRKMAEDLLETYVEVYKDYVALDKMLEKDGLLVEVIKGTLGSERPQMVKNPAFDMRRNCISQMADLANKIARFVKDQPEQAEKDEFDDFIAG